MTPGLEASGDQPSEMQLAGRLALSAAAFLLLALAYRYYKSRVSGSSRQGVDGERGEAGKNAEEKESLHCGGAGREEELPPGLRHRRVNGTGAKSNGRAGPAAMGKCRLQGTPVGRELAEGKEEKEQERGRMNGLGTGEESGKTCPVAEAMEKKENKTLGAILSNRGGARATSGTAAMGSKGRSASPDLLGPGGGICNCNGSHKGPGRDSGSVKAELGLVPQEKERGEREPYAANGNGSTLEGGKEQPPGEGLMQQVARIQKQQGSSQLSFRATSDMGLEISQSHARLDTAHTFFSVAEVRVEESLIKEGRGAERSNGQPEIPGPNLRGKVYDYHIQSVSQSVLKEKPSYASLGTQPYPKLPAMDMPKDPEERLNEEPAHTSSTEEEEERTALQEGPSPGSLLSLTQDEAKPSQNEAVVQAKSSKKPPETGGCFSRKDSLHKIIDNPELQVPMEGFGCLASGSSAFDTPPLSPLRSSSVSSLVGSMQSLQSETSEEPVVELVAGAKFFHVPLSSESSIDVHLDLGNCYEVLCMAKKQKLESLREAAYKVMSDNYLHVLRTYAIYSRLNAMERDLILQRRMRGRKYMTVADVSSQDHSQHASRLCYYDDQKDTWHPLTYVPLEAVSRGCAMCSMFNYLFVVAGCEGRGKHQKPSNRVFCYNPVTNIWREICPLNQARPHCKLVALDGCLYAIGGECLYTVERYDPRLDRWTFIAPLPNDTFAVAHTATVCDGEIYVTGGTLRYMLLRYTGRSDTWKISLTGGSKHRTTEMATVNGFIYRFDLNRSMGISVYRCSARAKLWYECATNPIPFPACFQCAVVENLVYCVSRQFNIRFLADYISPRFGTKELQNFPSPRGTLFPVTLVLPDKEVVQTRV
ncbi:kelch domain-containing protein 7A [Rhineura floridana]|uniref:kelch domain-containing protein 7A n=1 Tax=Rhineura floridana TaxID=261503 RepID=UPI002AC7EE4C|nr:kelch domain-containing protein 7A [Rhineura floridana]